MVQKAINETHKRFPSTTCQHKRGPFEFSCGIDMTRVLVVKESLEEGERKE